MLLLQKFQKQQINFAQKFAFLLKTRSAMKTEGEFPKGKQGTYLKSET